MIHRYTDSFDKWYTGSKKPSTIPPLEKTTFLHWSNVQSLWFWHHSSLTDFLSGERIGWRVGLCHLRMTSWSCVQTVCLDMTVCLWALSCSLIFFEFVNGSLWTKLTMNRSCSASVTLGHPDLGISLTFWVSLCFWISLLTIDWETLNPSAKSHCCYPACVDNSTICHFSPSVNFTMLTTCKHCSCEVYHLCPKVHTFCQVFLMLVFDWSVCYLIILW